MTSVFSSENTAVTISRWVHLIAYYYTVDWMV